MPDCSTDMILPGKVSGASSVWGCMADQAASGYVPLLRRSADQLEAKAQELRLMAATATTAEVMQALSTLADRYAALAIQRRDEQSPTE